MNCLTRSGELVPLGSMAGERWGLDGERAALRAQSLQQLALGAIRNKELAVELDEDLLNKLEARLPPESRLPEAIDLNLFVLASSPQAIDAGEFQIMLGPNVEAPTSGRHLGRFAHLLGAQACEALARIAQSEEALYRNHIIAEVVSLTELPSC